jgi:hypothetical protein
MERSRNFAILKPIAYSLGTSAMPQIEILPTIEQVKQLAFQLSPPDLITLLNDIQERLYTNEMMQIAESGFQEWNDPEEDIYNAEP